MFIITPTSDDGLCDVVVRAVNTQKTLAVNDEKLQIDKGVECSQGAIDRIRELAELRSNDNEVEVGRKVVAVPPERSPPRKRGERCEVVDSGPARIGRGRPVVTTIMFNAIKNQLEQMGIDQRQIVEQMIREVDDRGWLLDTTLEVFRELRAVSAAAGASQTGDTAAPAVAQVGE